MKKTFNEWARNRKENSAAKEIGDLIKTRMEYINKFWKWENSEKLNGEPFPVYKKLKL